MTFGITMGDSSGVGPEILLKAFRNGELHHRVVAFGDLAILEHCNQKLGFGVALETSGRPDGSRGGLPQRSGPQPPLG